MTPSEYLARLTWAGADERYPEGVPAKVSALIRRELTLIEELRYEAFFLTVWDLVRFARRRGILCQGRGSAANSAVCYCLGITSVDPERIDLLFERFISRERNEAPDIDVDFEHERREEVIQYIYTKYGRDRAGIAAEVITYRPRSAVRDVGKALGLSLDRVDRLAKSLDYHSGEDRLPSGVREAGFDPQAPAVQHLLGLASEMLGFPRHLSQHVGGFVITRGPLSELVPIENAAMPDRTVIEWDKDDLDTLGHPQGRLPEPGHADGDPQVFRSGRRGTTASALDAGHGPGGGSGGLRHDLPGRHGGRLSDREPGPDEHAAAAAAALLLRPGRRGGHRAARPDPGGMVHPYLRRRNGEEPVDLSRRRSSRRCSSKTLGVPLFQEQAMRLAIVAAGLHAGRGRPAAPRDGGLAPARHHRAAFATSSGTAWWPAACRPSSPSRSTSRSAASASTAFPNRTRPASPCLVYVSAWLKCHYPAAFAAAPLNSQPMGFYAPAQLVRDAQKHGVDRAADRRQPQRLGLHAGTN